MKRTYRTKKEKIADIKELCRYLEGGGIDTRDIFWLIEDHEKLEANRAEWIAIARANKKRKELKNSNKNC